MSKRRRGVRTQRNQMQKQKKMLTIVRYLILYTIVGIVAFMAYGFFIEARVRNVEQGEIDGTLLEKEAKEQLESKQDKTQQNRLDENSVKKQTFERVSATFDGHDVDCRLEVPKIKLKTNVLADYTKSGLKVCASKYYGPKANEEGNYCIAGHNYNKENMFNHLIQLNIGDSLFITDNTNGKVEYTIYDIYKVKPNNVEPLSQKTRGEKEVTLITCVNYSSRRLVVKAIEKDIV